MKKIFAFLLATLLLVSLSAAAFADAANDNVYDYSMIDESVYDGAWYLVSEVVDMYLPTDWVDIDTTTADFDENTCFVYANKDGKQMVMMQFVEPKDVAEMEVETMEELADALVLAGYEDAEVWEINEIVTVVYTDVDNDALNVMIAEENGGLYVISFWPQSDDSFHPAIFNMLVSISVPEE